MELPLEFKKLSSSSSPKLIRTAGVLYGKRLIKNGEHILRAFEKLYCAVTAFSEQKKVSVPQQNLTIGNICLDTYPITEKDFTYLNEALGVIQKSSVFKKIQKEKEKIEKTTPRGYRLPGGLDETKKLLTNQVNHWHLKVNSSDAFFTEGATPGLLIGMVAARNFTQALKSSFQAIFPIPGYVPTLQLIKIVSGGFQSYVTVQGSGQDFNLTPDDIIKASQNKKPSLLVLTPVSNPLGMVIDPDLTRASIKQFLKINPQGIILLDWAYLLTLDLSQAKKITAVFDDKTIQSHCIHITSFAKGWADPGVRVAVCHAPKKSILANGLSLYDFFNTALGIVQPTAARATEIETIVRARLVDIKYLVAFAKLLKLRRDELFDFFEKSNLFEKVIKSEGSLYIFGKLKKKTARDAFDFYIRTGIALVDGIAFMAPKNQGWVRASIARCSLNNIINLEKIL